MRRAAAGFVTGLGWLAMAAVTGAEVFVYPKPGVGQDQMRRDQYECHTWATTRVRSLAADRCRRPGPAAWRGGARRRRRRGGRCDRRRHRW